MDALEFLKEKKRMCEFYSNNCEKCLLQEDIMFPLRDCDYLEEYEPDKLVELVEKWAKEHPLKTNFDALKEVFGSEIVREVELSNAHGCMLSFKCRKDECKNCNYNDFWKREYKEPERSESE